MYYLHTFAEQLPFKIWNTQIKTTTLMQKVSL